MSSTNNKASLDEVLAALEDPVRINRISDRMEDALQAFRVNEISSHIEFNGELRRFACHIYRTGLPVPRVISPRTALSEAIALLDRHYGGDNGYYEAYLDAIDKEGKGFDFVLRSLTEMIKEIEIERKVNWQFASTIDPCDREEHLRIVTEILARFGSYLPEGILSGNPARFVRNYRQLLEIIISTNSLIKGIESSQNFPRI